MPKQSPPAPPATTSVRLAARKALRVSRRQPDAEASPQLEQLWRRQPIEVQRDAIAPGRRGDLARLGLRALFVGFVATLLNAAIAGVFLGL